MRCPSCGALNPARAAWCTQCFVTLAPAGPAPPEQVEEPRPTPDPVGDIRTVDGEVEWRCPRCGGWSPLATGSCTTCGGPRTGFGGDPPRPATITAARVLAAVVAVAVVVLVVTVLVVTGGTDG